MNAVLSRIDDWLIDSVFQSICNWIRMTFGWSRNIPMILSLLLIPYASVMAVLADMRAGTSFPLLTFWSLLFSFLALLVLFYVGRDIYRYMMDEIAGGEKSTGAFNAERVKAQEVRLIFLVNLALLPLLGFFLDPWLAWLGFTCRRYFSACTDLPKPKRDKVSKVVFQG